MPKKKKQTKKIIFLFVGTIKELRKLINKK